MKIIDLSHPFDAGIPVYPGDPSPQFRTLAEIGTDGYRLGEITTVLHAGTHIDAPGHMLSAGAAVADVPIERFVGRGVLIDVRQKAQIDSDFLSGIKLQQGDIVLFMSGRSGQYRKSEYFQDGPVVTESCARMLVAAGISMLGIDFASPDRPPFPVHCILLEGGVLIIENLANLELLLVHEQFEIIALPVRLAAEAAPARVIARIVP